MAQPKSNIRKTILTDDKIEMAIGDAAVREDARTWLDLVVPVEGSVERPLAIARLKALRIAQTLIDEEISLLVHLLNSMPEAVLQSEGNLLRSPMSRP